MVENIAVRSTSSCREAFGATWRINNGHAYSGPSHLGSVVSNFFKDAGISPGLCCFACLGSNCDRYLWLSLFCPSWVCDKYVELHEVGVLAFAIPFVLYQVLVFNSSLWNEPELGVFLSASAHPWFILAFLTDMTNSNIRSGTAPGGANSSNLYLMRFVIERSSTC